METLFGKSFDYSKEIPDLDDFRIDTDGDFDQLELNIDGLFAYTDIALKGPPLGVNYFLYTGKCSGEPDQGKSMYKYIRNIPTGNTFLGSKMKGVVPGILEDMSELNPIQIIKPLFVTPKNKSLSDHDKNTESNCKKIKRLNKVCKYRKCDTNCEEKRVSKNYDECKDLDKEPRKWSSRYSVFCSKEDRDNTKKKCEAFTNYKNTIEQYENLKDTNYLTVIIITVMIFLFTYFLINRN